MLHPFLKVSLAFSEFSLQPSLLKIAYFPIFKTAGHFRLLSFITSVHLGDAAGNLLFGVLPLSDFRVQPALFPSSTGRVSVQLVMSSSSDTWTSSAVCSPNLHLVSFPSSRPRQLTGMLSKCPRPEEDLRSGFMLIPNISVLTSVPHP